MLQSLLFFPLQRVIMFVLLFTVYVVKFQSDTVHKTLQSTPLTSEKEEARNNGFEKNLFLEK